MHCLSLKKKICPVQRPGSLLKFVCLFTQLPTKSHPYQSLTKLKRRTVTLGPKQWYLAHRVPPLEGIIDWFMMTRGSSQPAWCNMALNGALEGIFGGIGQESSSTAASSLPRNPETVVGLSRPQEGPRSVPQLDNMLVFKFCLCRIV